MQLTKKLFNVFLGQSAMQPYMQTERGTDQTLLHAKEVALQHKFRTSN
jgi:hypothetical protein